MQLKWHLCAVAAIDAASSWRRKQLCCLGAFVSVAQFATQMHAHMPGVQLNIFACCIMQIVECTILMLCSMLAQELLVVMGSPVLHGTVKVPTSQVDVRGLKLSPAAAAATIMNILLKCIYYAYQPSMLL
jgi:hypothetical protein